MFVQELTGEVAIARFERVDDLPMCLLYLEQIDFAAR
jgi:hypothetical protein